MARQGAIRQNAKRRRIPFRVMRSLVMDVYYHEIAIPEKGFSAMDQSSQQQALRSLPQVEELLRDARIKQLETVLPRNVVVEAARDAVDAVRRAILDGASASADVDDIAQDAARRALKAARPSLRRVINAAGVVIHTNLGRSVLADRAVEAAAAVAGGYSTLEYDTDAMARGSRHDHCENLLCLLTGAEAAIAVNNNAAAVLLVLTEFAKGREAVVSRGQLVEIGGSFRVPDIMELSGARMVEVGTTNKTHAADYERAISENTAMLLKVHPSNYRMTGFTESVNVKKLRMMADAENALRSRERAEAAEAEHRRIRHSSDAYQRCLDDLIVYEDQGSGALVRLDCFGEYAEPAVAESLREGCDLVSFSGDKLLGGPQAGIIVGRKQLIDRLRANPLSRAVRLDKMTLAALEETLRIYLDRDRALQEIPTLRMLSATPDDLRPRADALARAIEEAIPESAARIDIVDEISRAGGGALPMCDIPTLAVRVSFDRGSALDCERALIVHRKTPIVGRIKKDALLFDVRTLVHDDEIDAIAQGLSRYFEEATR